VGAAYQYYQQRYHAFDAEIGPSVVEILQNQIKPIGTVDEKSVELSPKAYSDEEVLELAQALHIDHLLERKITTLSNGETRRTLIALALLKKPKFLLLDNPFSGLDANSRELLRTILSSQTNTTMILVASPNDLPQNISKILVLGDKTLKQTLRAPFQKESLAFKISTNTNVDLLKDLKNANAEADFDYALRFRKLKVVYNQKAVVDHIDWEVKRGERWALMGPNGSGKSTILSIITTDNPQAYQNDFDLFDRKRGTGESIWDIKKRIGFVSPELHLFFNRNTEVWKAVASGLFDAAGLFKKLSDQEQQTVFDYLKLLNLEALAQRKLAHLSTGQQRQVFLARALVKNPPLLLLDEPCQGLDFNHMVYFRELVNDIVLALDKTLIYVTHYEEEIPACVNQRFNLFEGRRV
jgi:molybdate transport system ATP-binding protein